MNKYYVNLPVLHLRTIVLLAGLFLSESTVWAASETKAGESEIIGAGASGSPVASAPAAVREDLELLAREEDARWSDMCAKYGAGTGKDPTTERARAYFRSVVKSLDHPKWWKTVSSVLWRSGNEEDRAIACDYLQSMATTSDHKDQWEALRCLKMSHDPAHKALALRDLQLIANTPEHPKYLSARMLLGPRPTSDAESVGIAVGAGAGAFGGAHCVAPSAAARAAVRVSAGAGAGASARDARDFSDSEGEGVYDLDLERALEASRRTTLEVPEVIEARRLLSAHRDPRAEIEQMQVQSAIAASLHTARPAAGGAGAAADQDDDVDM